MMVTSVLLFVWLSLSCQNCFAIDVQENSHASMDCCPTGMQLNQGSGHADVLADNCATASLIDQPAVSEEIKLQVEDQHLLAISVYAADYPSSASSGAVGFNQQQSFPFSHRLFSSYRILLI